MSYDDTDWSLIDFNDQKPAAPAKATTIKPSECPKCGKQLGRKARFHIKGCHGNPRKAG